MSSDIEEPVHSFAAAAMRRSPSAGVPRDSSRPITSFAGKNSPLRRAGSRASTTLRGLRASSTPSVTSTRRWLRGRSGERAARNLVEQAERRCRVDLQLDRGSPVALTSIGAGCPQVHTWRSPSGLHLEQGDGDEVLGSRLAQHGPVEGHRQAGAASARCSRPRGTPPGRRPTSAPPPFPCRARRRRVRAYRTASRSLRSGRPRSAPRWSRTGTAQCT